MALLTDSIPSSNQDPVIGIKTHPPNPTRAPLDLASQVNLDENVEVRNMHTKCLSTEEGEVEVEMVL